MAIEVHLSGPALAAATCIDRLGPLGWTRTAGPDPAPMPPDDPVAGITLEAPDETGPEVCCRITWWPGPAGAEGEAAVQAELGLMHLHGLEAGAPRLLGLAAASVAAGMLAAQGVLAALIGSRRGATQRTVTTSVAAAAAFLIAPAIARAGAAGGDVSWPPPRPAGGPGPPFPTADGRLIEIDTLAPQPWADLWTALGVAHADIATSWRAFSARYATASCTLPPSLHAATATRTADELAATAAACGMSLCLVRTAHEVRADPPESRARHPLIQLRPPSPLLRPAPASATSAAPLGGITVLEAGSRVQGPLAGQLLRMLGARVLHIEPPGGDPARLVPPLARETGAFHLAMNRGKEPVELDLGSAAGAARLRELAAEADVFLHNWPPGRAERLGATPEGLAAGAARLVHCHASGWGAAAAGAPPLAVEYLVQAHSGLADALTAPGEPPRPTRVLLADVTGALLACEGVLAGLWLRERTGRGSRVDTSLMAAAMTLQHHRQDNPDGGRALLEAEVPPAHITTDLRSLPSNPLTAPVLEPVEGVSMVGSPWRWA